jgi:hypothetical protein
MRPTLFILLLLVEQCAAQNFSWVKINEVPLPQICEYWEIDGLGNYYFVNNQQIEKSNAQGKVIYQTSTKKQGEVSQLIYINALKMIVFSELQQQICILDNTLTNNGNCISFENMGLQSVKLIGNSNRPNLIWLYDEYNAGLYLFDYVTNKIIQSVTNMTSIVGLSNVKQLIEIESNLYVLDAHGKIIVFDLFMNQKFNFTINGEKIYTGERSISTIKNNKLTNYSLLGEVISSFDLPVESELTSVQGNYYYFQNKNKIIKFELKRD